LKYVQAICFLLTDLIGGESLLLMQSRRLTIARNQFQSKEIDKHLAYIEASKEYLGELAKNDLQDKSRKTALYG
jgi:hypothetical protein